MVLCFPPLPLNDVRTVVVFGSFGARYIKRACVNRNVISLLICCVPSTFHLNNLAFCSVRGSPLLIA